MKTLISGHRKFKLLQYNIDWIKEAIEEIVILSEGNIIGLSGMADGIDLIFCDILLKNNMGYFCYVPFDTQDEYMSDGDKNHRQLLLSKAWSVYHAKNSQMVEDAESGIIIWDGNKGGTHNVFQQMLEKKKPFFWIEPNKCKVYNID